MYYKVPSAVLKSILPPTEAPKDWCVSTSLWILIDRQDPSLHSPGASLRSSWSGPKMLLKSIRCVHFRQPQDHSEWNIKGGFKDRRRGKQRKQISEGIHDMDTDEGEGDKELGGRMQKGIRMLLCGPSGRCRSSENPQGLFPLCSTSAISAGALWVRPCFSVFQMMWLRLRFKWFFWSHTRTELGFEPGFSCHMLPAPSPKLPFPISYAEVSLRPWPEPTWISSSLTPSQAT